MFFQYTFRGNVVLQHCVQNMKRKFTLLAYTKFYTPNLKMITSFSCYTKSLLIMMSTLNILLDLFKSTLWDSAAWGPTTELVELPPLNSNLLLQSYQARISDKMSSGKTFTTPLLLFFMLRSIMVILIKFWILNLLTFY